VFPVLLSRRLRDRFEQRARSLPDVDGDLGIDVLQIPGVVGVRVGQEDPLELRCAVREIRPRERGLGVEPLDARDEIELEQVLDGARGPRLQEVHIELLERGREGRAEIKEDAFAAILDDDFVPSDLSNAAEEGYGGPGHDRFQGTPWALSG